MLIECLRLLVAFFVIGFLGFGGGYAMLSMIMTQSLEFSVSAAQFADLSALDLIVPGPIAINAATYVGYLHQGIAGAVVATVGICLPSIAITAIFMQVLKRYKNNHWLEDVLSGIKPASVGLIAAAAFTIASEVLLKPGESASDLFANPLAAISVECVIIFVVTALLCIKTKINPIFLTLIAGLIGAFIFA